MPSNSKTSAIKMQFDTPDPFASSANHAPREPVQPRAHIRAGACPRITHTQPDAPPAYAYHQPPPTAVSAGSAHGNPHGNGTGATGRPSSIYLPPSGATSTRAQSSTSNSSSSSIPSHTGSSFPHAAPTGTATASGSGGKEGKRGKRSEEGRKDEEDKPVGWKNRYDREDSGWDGRNREADSHWEKMRSNGIGFG